MVFFARLIGYLAPLLLFLGPIIMAAAFNSDLLVLGAACLGLGLAAIAAKLDFVIKQIAQQNRQMYA